MGKVGKPIGPFITALAASAWDYVGLGLRLGFKSSEDFGGFYDKGT